MKWFLNTPKPSLESDWNEVESQRFNLNPPQDEDKVRGSKSYLHHQLLLKLKASHLPW